MVALAFLLWGVVQLLPPSALVGNPASFLLPVANPANLRVLSRAPLSLGAFLARLLLPSALAIGLTLAGLLVVCGAELAAPFALPSARPRSEPAWW